MGDEERLDRSGAYDWEELVDQNREPPPDEFSNPPGIGRGDCDAEDAVEKDDSCAVEIKAQVEDLFMEETKPGYGIAGYEGEESGGG